MFALHKKSELRVAARDKLPSRSRSPELLLLDGRKDALRNTARTLTVGLTLVAGLLATGAVAANAAPQEFRGRGEGRVERGYGPEYRRGLERPIVREYGRPYVGYGVGYGYGYAAPVAGYIPPCPGDGYVWIDGAWVFRGFGIARGYGYGRGVRFDHGFDRGFEHGADRGFRGRR